MPDLMPLQSDDSVMRELVLLHAELDNIVRTQRAIIPQPSGQEMRLLLHLQQRLATVEQRLRTLSRQMHAHYTHQDPEAAKVLNALWLTRGQDLTQGEVDV